MSNDDHEHEIYNEFYGQPDLPKSPETLLQQSEIELKKLKNHPETFPMKSFYISRLENEIRKLKMRLGLPITIDVDWEITDIRNDDSYEDEDDFEGNGGFRSNEY